MVRFEPDTAQPKVNCLHPTVPHTTPVLTLAAVNGGLVCVEADPALKPLSEVPALLFPPPHVQLEHRVRPFRQAQLIQGHTGYNAT